MSLRNCIRSASPRFARRWYNRVEASPLGYRLARGAFWSFAGAVTSRALGLVASILVARMLGKAGFGELGIIQSTVGMFGTFAGFGLGVTATKHVAEFWAKDPARAGRIIGLSSMVSWAAGCAMAALLFLLAPWLAASTLASPHLEGLLRISSLLVLLGAINGAQTGALAGFEAFRRISHINLIAGIAAFPLMVGGAWSRGVEGALIGLVLSLAVNCLLNYRGLRKEAGHAGVPLTYAGSSREWSVLWGFSLPALASSLLVGPVHWLCSTMLVNRPDGYAQMGIFNAANQWFGALLFLPALLAQAALPVLSERLGDNDSAVSRTVLTFYIKLNALLVVPLVLLGSLVSPYIMAFYGKGFERGWPTLVVVLTTAGLLAVLSTVGQVLIASGRLWLGAFMNLGWGASYLAFTLLLVSYGAFGLACARLSAYVVHAIWTFGFALHIIKASRTHSEVGYDV